MKFRPSNFIQLPLATIVLFLSFSCNKDSDLLAEYVIEQPQAFMVNDIVVTLANRPIVIEPLSNDTFKEPEKVTITEVTPPKMGTAEVQEDNTVVYTPNTDETGTDEFDYTTTVTNPDNSVSTETGSITVTVTPTDKTSPITGDNIYYVTTTGKSSNKGATEASAWSIQHAFNTAKAGDIIYVKAGNYGDVELLVKNSGADSKPIQFIGYKDNPGDIVSSDGPTYTFEHYKSNGDNLDSSKMPLLKGSRSNGIGSGMGIKIDSKNYISIENFMIRDYEYGIYSRGNYSKFNNIISVDHGDFNSAHSYPNGTSDLHKNLSGNGFWITSSSNFEISNCLAINNGARGIAIIGSNNSLLNNNAVYSDNNTNPTDYYIMVYGSNNLNLNNNLVKRIGALSHPGHGYSVKVGSEYNTFTNCRAEGTSFELNNRAAFNTFKDCHVEGQGLALSGGWKITNYSHDNKFINCSNNAGEGIVFSDWKESDGNNGIDTAAFNNTFKNCTITNTVDHSGAIIDFHWNDQSGRLTSYARDNEFIDCTFSGANNLFKVDRVTKGNKFVNCTISDIKSLRTSRFDVNKSLSLGVELTNIITKNIGFSLSGN